MVVLNEMPVRAVNISMRNCISGPIPERYLHLYSPFNISLIPPMLVLNIFASSRSEVPFIQRILMRPFVSRVRCLFDRYISMIPLRANIDERRAECKGEGRRKFGRKWGDKEG